MRIVCPFCGERELGEFTYLGDAKPLRPAAG
ncbi:MAG: sarcosine oxidase subunit delta, partial [Mesorhizobium sp.]